VTGSLRNAFRELEIGPATGAEIACSDRGPRRARFCVLPALRKGERLRARCSQIASGGFALDLAILAEGLIAVPLYARPGRPAELVAMMRDAGAGLVCCSDAAFTATPSAGPVAGCAALSRCLTKFFADACSLCDGGTGNALAEQHGRHHLHVGHFPAKRKA